MAEIAGQIDIFGEETPEDAEYQAFVDKFKPKKTADDCYTPEPIYDAVADWVAAEYGVERAAMVRPFWPGGDYERFDYPAGCCVVDNPPFSIITQIQRFYLARGIRYFLFAPTLTLFSARDLDATFIPCGVKITYENGANVNTSFATNLDTCRVRSAPGLYQAVKAANDANVKAQTKQLQRYSYPAEVLTAAAAYQYSHYGVEYRLEKADCTRIDAMDAQRLAGKEIFGSGFLLSERAAAERAAAERAAAERAAAERAAAERAAAERAAAHVLELSEREREIVRRLGTDNA